MKAVEHGTTVYSLGEKKRGNLKDYLFFLGGRTGGGSWRPSRILDQKSPPPPFFGKINLKGEPRFLCHDQHRQEKVSVKNARPGSEPMFLLIQRSVFIWWPTRCPGRPIGGGTVAKVSTCILHQEQASREMLLPNIQPLWHRHWWTHSVYFSNRERKGNLETLLQKSPDCRKWLKLLTNEAESLLHCSRKTSYAPDFNSCLLRSLGDQALGSIKSSCH